MTDRPEDRYVDPAYADPTYDPSDPRYAADRAEAQQDVADDRPRVVRDDAAVEPPADYATGAGTEPGTDVPTYRAVDDRTLDDGLPGRHRTVETDAALAAAGPHGRPSVEERARIAREAPVVVPDTTLVREREEAVMGGIKWGSAFFGWLAAMGVAAVLTALLAAAGTALALNNPTATSATTDLASSDPGTASTIGLTGAVAVLIVMFVAYLAGGYVAGRMARIDGPRQGLGVWIWMIAIVVVAALVATLAGTAYDVLGRLNTFPRIPLDGTQLAAAGVITIVLAALVSLAGALLGGAAGMRYHRRMDAVGLGLTDAVVERSVAR